MERVSRHLEDGIEPTSRNAVSTAIKGNTAAVRLAIDTLTREGYITETPGARNARLLQSERPYREASEPTSTTSTDFDLTSTETKSKSTSTTSTTSTVPLQGDEVAMDEVDELHDHDLDQVWA